MEASVKAAKVLAPPQAEVAAPSLDSDGLGHAAAAVPSGTLDPMDEFRQRLEDIISGYSSATNSLLEKQRMVEAEMEKKMEETQEDTAVTMETELAAIMQTLNRLSSPEDKLKTLVHKYTEMAALRRGDEKKLTSLQQAFNLLLDERKLLHLEQHHSVTARGQLECLCRDLQSQYDVLREEAIQHCRDDEEKRNEMTDHFQNMLKEIQDQIELHNSRNQKLCHENTSLTTKLESLMNQCEMREESLEKINKHRDLQHKLTEAKLQQATAQLAEAEEKHKREKEYLLREAIDKTKKCFTMKEEELTMKKKLTLYSQKFDEFQETLSKSNEIYVRFKKEMDNMSEKMKKMDKESNLWKTRFENCNKALTDMIEERNERSKEYEVFVLKIQRLEKLCRALQDERKVLYDKIRDVRRTNANIPSRLEGLYESDDIPNKPPALTEEEFQELEELQKEDPVLTQDMARLKEEQAKLQEFAAALLASPEDEDDDKKESLDVEEDSVASAFAKFSTKLQDKEVSEQEEKSESETHQEVKAVKTVSFSETLTTIEITPEPKPEPEKEEPQVDIKEDKPVETEKPKPEVEKAETQPKDKPEPEQNPVVTPEPENIIPGQSTGPKPQTAEAIPVVPVEEEKTEPEQKPEEEGPESENTARTADEPAKKQTPKKKKKRTGRV